MVSIGAQIEEAQEARVVDKWMKEERVPLTATLPYGDSYEEWIMWAQEPSTRNQKEWQSYLKESYASNCFWVWVDESETMRRLRDDYKYRSLISLHNIDRMWPVFENDDVIVEEFLLAIALLMILQERVSVANLDRTIKDSRLTAPIEFPVDLGELLDRRNWRPA